MVWILCGREEKEVMVMVERGSGDWRELGWEGDKGLRREGWKRMDREKWWRGGGGREDQSGKER